MRIILKGVIILLVITSCRKKDFPVVSVDCKCGVISDKFIIKTNQRYYMEVVNYCSGNILKVGISEQGLENFKIRDKFCSTNNSAW